MDTEKIKHFLFVFQLRLFRWTVKMIKQKKINVLLEKGQEKLLSVIDKKRATIWY